MIEWNMSDEMLRLNTGQDDDSTAAKFQHVNILTRYISMPFYILLRRQDVAKAI